MELSVQPEQPRVKKCRKCGRIPVLTRWTSLYYECPCGEEGPDGHTVAEAAAGWNREQRGVS